MPGVDDPDDPRDPHHGLVTSIQREAIVTSAADCGHPLVIISVSYKDESGTSGVSRSASALLLTAATSSSTLEALKYLLYKPRRQNIFFNLKSS